ncbi:MAG: hemerythrin domain-containing protein [candidate division KSB1 bacterium]|nr:hemerythrin domain-containing protein [candidate division KSB1 bacterium]MDZ7294334.1 hemerythrin domain-containing protein [candidate division KSB1 bacterium]MDZ7385507.1 hemerythrin domain-containing protein [candidate division KSB1 bacterium]MDZ7393298.1 hemerythrin domain-containing protein [candidate division KSB1 bacterium]MDZ7413166.1 hemerythrin domain-containing protein [candidate division KSB1 bacterium]
MRPTQTLMEEHRIILMVVEQAELEAERIVRTANVDHARVEQMVDFFRNFADRCHHRKEEEHLFKLLSAKPSARGPVVVMLQEHEMGRGFLRSAQEGLRAWGQGNSAAARQVAKALRDYAELLRFHIAKEEQVLFPLAERILTPSEEGELATTFERVEEEEIGQGVHERYHGLAQELVGRKT